MSCDSRPSWPRTVIMASYLRVVAVDGVVDDVRERVEAQKDLVRALVELAIGEEERPARGFARRAGKDEEAAHQDLKLSAMDSKKPFWTASALL